MKHRPKSQLTSAALGGAILIVLIQIYLFETVLGAVLDGEHGLLAGALAVSTVLSAVALYLAFKAPRIDKES